MIGMLPINPYKISVIIPIIFARILSDLKNESFYLTLNNLGFNKHISSCHILGELYRWHLNIERTLYDSTEYKNNISLVQKIYKEKKSLILICQCGRLEMPIELLNIRHKIEHTVLSGRICKLCKTSQVIEPYSLYYCYDYFPQEINVFPQAHYKEILNNQRELMNREERISRVRDTGFAFIYNDKDYFLDVDYLSLEYLSSLIYNEVDTLIISSKQSFLAAKISYFLQKKVKILQIPYCKNFDLIYPILQEKLNNIYQLFILMLMNLSWKNNSYDINMNDINIVRKLSVEKIFNILGIYNNDPESFFKRLSKKFILSRLNVD